MPSVNNHVTTSNVSAIRLEFLNTNAKALVDGGAQPKQLEQLLADEITLIQRKSGRKVVFNETSSNGGWFAFSPAAVGNRAEVTTTQRQGVQMLSAKIDGVPISVNLRNPKDDMTTTILR